MANIKSFTDISQSKTLSKILPHESADNYYSWHDERYYVVNKDCPYPYSLKEKIPCWSFAALLSVLPKIGAEEPMVRKLYYASKPVERYICEYGLTNMTSEYDNPVDACVAMIEKLHELKML